MIETSPQISAALSQDRPVNSMLTVRDLIKTIDGQVILRGVDRDVAHGETLAIIGRSGGGKSVLLKHLVGLMQPDAGEIWIEGQDITGLNERQLSAIRQKIGILFQGAALFDSMTVGKTFPFRCGKRVSVTKSSARKCPG